MTRLRLVPELALDIQRITAHLQLHEAARVNERVADILGALQIPAQHPLIGRPAAQGQRELVIGHDASGYLARYAYDELDDLVVVIALRSQCEAGFVDR